MELVIFIGLQGAGKSTFFQARFAKAHAYVSKDLMRNNRDPNRRQGVLVEAALREGRSVVVDNTHPRVEDRAVLIALGRVHGARVVGYYFRPDLAGSLRRNAKREGKARVPNVAIFATRKRLQPPTPAEGFDALYVVEPTANHHFRVEPWTEADAVPLTPGPPVLDSPHDR
ncbi:MAG TPA: ATP-binding protein [Myxococcaceae bacterium]|nr:ATP-binding protein [Myxococcaceae bacterium]